MVRAGRGGIYIEDFEKGYTCEVHDKRQVEFEGSVMSLSSVAQTVLERSGSSWKAV